MNGEGFDEKMYDTASKDQKNTKEKTVPPINKEADRQDAKNMTKTKKYIDDYLKNSRPMDSKKQNNEYAQKIAEKMGYKSGSLKKLFYDTLQEYGVYDEYSNYTKKELSKLENKYGSLQKDISAKQLELEGRVLYVPMVSGSEEEFRKRRLVPESQKGLEYKMNENKNLSDIALTKYRSCELKSNQYSAQIIKMDQDIVDERQKPQSEATIQRINALVNERNELVQQKETYQGLMADFSQQVIAKDELYKAHKDLVTERKLFLNKSKVGMNRLGITVEIMRTYIGNSYSGGKSLDKILDDLEYAMSKGQMVVDAIGVMQESNATRSDRIDAINGGMGESIVQGDYFKTQEQELNKVYTESFSAVNRIAAERGV